MKCISRSLLIVPLLIFSIALAGCGEPIANEYNVYDSANSYIAETGTDISPELFASDLCVGGTVNSRSDIVHPEYSESCALFNVTNGEIKYANNIYEKLYPASTTKILTAYIALQNSSLDDLVTVSSEAMSTVSADSSKCGLNVGDQITMRELIYGLMLVSGNDAANVIACHISGSIEAFADLMNDTALSLGATGSHFVNSCGLPDPEHYTTAYDLYLIFNAAIKNEAFVNYINTAEHTALYLDSQGNQVEKTWRNTNGYLTGSVSTPEGVTVVGGKTGTTFAAGHCLVMLSKNEAGEDLISIVLKGHDKSQMYDNMSQLLKGFSK